MTNLLISPLQDHFNSLETLKKHNLIHNDVKPQNFLVKLNFEYDESSKMYQPDLTQVEIVLTDFGLAGDDVHGGTPIFASPECYGEKTTDSDTFSLGRTFLFISTPTDLFLKLLFVPIASDEDQDKIAKLLDREGSLPWVIQQMMKVENRMSLEDVRIHLDQMKNNSELALALEALKQIDEIVTRNMDKRFEHYVKQFNDVS